MKRTFCTMLLLASVLIASSQSLQTQKTSSEFTLDPPSLHMYQDSDYPISIFAISVNPLGFVEFGPIINVEVGIAGQLAINAHVRFATMGLLSRLIKDDDGTLDNLTGVAFGGGAIYFFGDRQNKPYAGILMEYEKTENTYSQGESDEEFEVDKTFVFMLNGGYRLRFDSGFFINVGAYLGAGHTNWTWERTDGSDYSEGGDVTPAGLVEVTLGFEF